MDPAFAMRYTLVNVGAFIGTFLVGILYKDVFAKDGVLGFAPCFKIAALIMFLGACWYFFVCWRFLGDVGKRPFKKTKTQEELAIDAEKTVEEKKETKKEPLTTIRKNVSVRSLLHLCSPLFSGSSGILDTFRYIITGQIT